MKNIFSKFSVENFIINLKKTFLRFPLSFVSSIIIFLIFEYIIYNWNIISNYTENILYKSILSITTIYFLSIWIYLLSEKFNFSKLKTLLFQFGSILFWVLFYFSFEQNLFNNFYSEQFVYIIITYIGVICFVFISPFIKKLLNNNIDNDKYYTYFNSLFSKILMSIIVWWFLTLLWFIALNTVFSLFELKTYLDENKFYWYWSAFSFSLFTPIYFLFIFPEKNINILLLDKIKENKFYNFLSNYIALPFIIIYFFILYSYSLKVLLNFSDWPKWIISWMVILFSLFWYLIYIFSYAFENKSILVKIFRKIFPFAVLFQTPMLFYTIYLRINQYDFTINRYLIVVFWIFLILISIYFIFSKKKYLLLISFLLTTFIIIISISPWWVYSFPELRQLELLKNDLIEAKIFQSGEIILPQNKKDIEAKLSWKIYEKISYLCSYHGCDSMFNIFWNVLDDIKNQDKIEWEKNHNERIKKIEEEIVNYKWEDMDILNSNKKLLSNLEKETYKWIDIWRYSNKLVEILKVEPYYLWNLLNQKYISFFLNYSKRNNFLEVSNYDYLLPILDINQNNILLNKWLNWTIVDENILFYTKYDLDNEIIFIYKNKILLEEFSLKDDLSKIYEQNINNINTNWFIELDNIVIIEKKWQKVEIKILLEDFVIKNPDYDWIDSSFYNINWKVLLREIK